MDVKTIFTKTAKGVTQVNQKTQSLSRDLMKVLKAIDGKSNLSALSDKADFPIPALEKALTQLQKEGFIKIFEVKQEVPLTDFGGDDDFDFTAPGKLAEKKIDFNATQGFKPSQYRTPASSDQVERAAPPPAFSKPKEDDAELQAALAAAREKAQIEARAKAERETQIRARLEVEAKAKRDAELRAMEEAKRAQVAAENARLDLEKKLAEEKKQRETLSDTRNRLTREQLEKETQLQNALGEARAKAEAEAQALATARAKAEAEAKALADQRKQADEAAKKQQAEFEAAQRELRHQLKAEIEAKVRAEMQEKLNVELEEGARAEVEAAVMEEAREEARRMLEEQLQAERSSLGKAAEEAKSHAEADAQRMLAEQEKRIRAEMEAQFAKIAEEKARVEIEARRMAEEQAEAAAKAAAELSARLKAEEEARRKSEAEMEARLKAEEESRRKSEAEMQAKMKAQEESRRQAEAEMQARIDAQEEARKVAEAEAEARKKAEAQSRARLEARAKEEAEERAKVEAEMNARIASEKEAKIQAQAKALVEAEMREKSDRENQARIVAEQQARAEAEAKALESAREREVASREAAEAAEARDRAQREADGRVAVERAAREKAEEKIRAEEEAEARQRAAQVARLKELEEQRVRDIAAGVDPDAKNRPHKFGAKKAGSPLRWVALGSIFLLIAAVAAVLLVPLTAVNARLAKGMSEWMHDDVSTDGMNIRLLPKPHVRLTQMAVGKVQDAKAGSAKLFMDMGTLFGDKFAIDTLELTEVTIGADALSRAVKWAQAEGRGKDVQIGKIELRSAKVDVKGVSIEPFDADITFDKAGKISKVNARTRDGKWTADFSPNKAGDAATATAEWLVRFSGRSINLPMGAAIPLASIGGEGVMSGDVLTFPKVDVKLLEGNATGSLKIDWKAGVAVASEFTAEKIKVDQLTEVFSRDITLSGRMDGQFALSASAPSVGELLDRPVITGNFAVHEGAVGNIDLVQAMRSPGSVGGQTKFAELTGQLRVGEGMIRYEKLRLTGGVLVATGAVGVVTSSSALSGTVGAEIRSSVAQDRANFGVSGKVSRPALKRG